MYWVEEIVDLSKVFNIFEFATVKQKYNYKSIKYIV